jgi:hypothetical protein
MFESEATNAILIQFNEPYFVMNLEAHQLEAFLKAYSYLETTSLCVNLPIGTHFDYIHVEIYKTFNGNLSLRSVIPMVGEWLARLLVDLLHRGF